MFLLYHLFQNLYSQYLNIEQAYYQAVKEYALEAQSNVSKSVTLTIENTSNLTFYVGRYKLLSSGYDKLVNYVFNRTCKVSIEKDEPCEISGKEPSYISFELKCGHKLSIMALTGIANVRSTNYSEGIVCPYCREKLIPALENNKASILEYPKVSYADEIDDVSNGETSSTPIKIEKIINTTMSKDNFDYVYSLLGITENNDDNEANNEAINQANMIEINNANIMENNQANIIQNNQGVIIENIIADMIQNNDVIVNIGANENEDENEIIN